MKKIATKDLKFIPASHEDQKDPGVLKKVLFKTNDFSKKGRIQMINWAKLKKEKSFIPHFHEDMDEVFIIISGKVRMRIDNEEEVLEKRDAVFVPMKSIHQMENIGNSDICYIALGVSLGKGGRTICIKNSKCKTQSAKPSAKLKALNF